jgi:hypothetical protein
VDLFLTSSLEGDPLQTQEASAFDTFAEDPTVTLSDLIIVKKNKLSWDAALPTS